MKRLIQLLRFPKINSILVMNIIYDELSGAFKDYDCEICIVNNFEDLRNEGIIFLDNGALITNRSILDDIGIKCPDVVYYCWYWADLPSYKPLDDYRPFKYIIYTGNNILKMPTVKHLIDEYNNYTQSNLFCPLKLRANEDPNLVGTYKRNVLRDYCFMGGGYKIDWKPTEFTGIYHQVIYNNYFSYDKRREIYLSSIFALGFHADLAIDCGSISQRVFEGLAYGCVVLCDNPIVEELTNGIVVTITSKKDLIEKMRYFKENPDLIIEKQNKGYEWVKKYGTNRESARLLLNKLKDVYNIEFD
jgi:hypothetical protein